MRAVKFQATNIGQTQNTVLIKYLIFKSINGVNKCLLNILRVI